MIRPATPADANRAVELLRDSHAAAGFDQVDGPTGFCVPFEPEEAMALFLAHLTMPRRLALVLEHSGTAQGLLLAAAEKHPFGKVWLARETAWWVDPAHRGIASLRMVPLYETWAHDQGCAFSGLAGMGDDPAIASYCLRRGYRPAEKHFLKAL